nr:outer membrane protein assembly factor BamE [Neisseria sp. 19428wB4_WF04]
MCPAIAVLLGLAACSSERVSHFPSYKLKVVQGNELDARAVASLQSGMSREQVQLLLGTPLLRDPFHADRWDYTFNIARNGVISEQRTLTLYFNNDRLARAEGNAIEYAVQQLQAGQSAEVQPQPQPVFRPDAQ